MKYQDSSTYGRSSRIIRGCLICRPTGGGGSFMLMAWRCRKDDSEALANREAAREHTKSETEGTQNNKIFNFHPDLYYTKYQYL